VKQCILKKILGTAFLVKKFLGNDIPWKKISLLCRITEENMHNAPKIISKAITDIKSI
jgi:hypothetical protein